MIVTHTQEFTIQLLFYNINQLSHKILKNKRSNLQQKPLFLVS